MSSWRGLISAAVWVVLILPTLAFAQTSISGTVRDSSGAVLPGVTVEVASPELIEKVRTAVSDGGGQYRIVDLRPGVYSISFQLSGFATVRQEGIELTGSMTATINADMRVGALEQTVIVTGEAQLVDVQTVGQQRTVSRQDPDSIPTGRTLQNMVALIPGITMSVTGAVPQDVGGSNFGPALQTVAIHGGRAGDQRIMMEGMSMNAVQAGGTTGFTPNMGAVQEVVVETSASGAEDSQGGVRMNIVPRQGGNTFSGNFFATGATSGFQSSNYTDRLARLGYVAPDPAKTLKMTRDITPALGGPIRRDRLWFYVAGNWHRTQNLVAGRPNLNAGNPAAWLYVPDNSGSAEVKFNDASVSSMTYRVTWQVNSVHKLSFYADDQERCICPEENAAVSPESAVDSRYKPSRYASATWSAPLTNRLLLNTALAHRWETWGDYKLPSSDDSFVQVTDNVLGITYRGGDQFTNNVNLNSNIKADMVYVTGAHSLKVGFVNILAHYNPEVVSNTENLSYTFLNRVPNLITLYATPTRTENRLRDFGVFVQDRWTINRLTLNAGVRFDYVHTYFPAQSMGPSPRVPTRNLTISETDWVAWKDISPRFGVAYDLFGNGRTALKGSVNKYLATATAGGNFGSNGNPLNRIASSTTRPWTDNGNFRPDCDLANPALQDNRASGGDLCGAMANAAFGLTSSVFNADPDLLNGWGRRGFNWEYSATVQQQLSSRISAEVGYFRRTYGNFTVQDNLSVTGADYDTFSFSAPADSRLPDGGGQRISGLFNIRQPGAVNNFLTRADNVGTQTERWHGVDVTGNVRAAGGLVVQGGLSTGTTLLDSCEIRAALPETAPTNPYCRTDTGFRTQVKALASYTVPRVDVQVSGSVQSIPGAARAANWAVPNAAVQPSLGRPLSGGAQTVTVNLIEPGRLYGERINQVDFRIGKILRLRRTRTNVNFDMFNLFNDDTIIGVNPTFSPTATTWLQPQTVLPGRVAKFSVQFDF